MRSALSFHLLGPLEVVRPDGSRIDLGGRQPRLVLGRLLVADGRVVPADSLLDMLWGEDPPYSASGTLQTYISRLRRALAPDGAELLQYGASGYRLDIDADRVDAHRFDHLAHEGSRVLAAGDLATAVQTLREALSLWRGEVLGGVDAPFVRSAAARWQDRRLACTEDLFDAELQVGRAAAVVADLADAVAAWPLRERLRGLLALALYRSGRQADALTALDQGRRLLGEELGLEPSRELRELQARILAQAPSLDLPGGTSTQQATTSSIRVDFAAMPETGAVPATPAHLTLVGRTAERGKLATALSETLSGNDSRYIIIEGEPGIGKTSLAQELLRRAAAAGAVCLSVATLESGAAPAFGPWLQVFREADREAGALPAVATDMFGATDAVDGAGRALIGAAPLGVAALADSVADTLRALAGTRGLVILLEDLQWADPASLHLLSQLAPRLVAAPVLLMTTVRELEVGRDDAVVEALAQMIRWSGTLRISLHGLSVTETGALLKNTGTEWLPEHLVAAVHARSDGNPFYAIELARMLGEQGDFASSTAGPGAVPNGVRDVVRRRVGALPAQTGSVMEIAAVVGRQVHLHLLSVIADRTLDQILDDLEPALQHRLLEVPPTAPGAVRFTHALVREALAEGMTSLRRARLHLRAADGILVTVGDTDDTAEIVAEHLWHAAAVGGAARAAAALERAAQVALKRQALVSVESLLERAASLYRGLGQQDAAGELRVLRQLGFVGAALHGYVVNAGSTLIRRVKELARETDRVDILLDVLWAEWAGCDTGGRPARAERLALEAEALVAGSGDPLLLGGAASMRGFSERHFGRMRSSLEHIDRAVGWFAQADRSQEAGFYLNGYLSSVGFRHWVRAMTSGLDRGGIEQDYLAQDLPFARMVIAMFGAEATMSAGDHQGLAVFAARMLAADPQLVLSFWSSSAELYSAVSLLQDGEWAAGLELFDRGRQDMADSGGRATLAGHYAAAAQALAAAGMVADARTMLDGARREIAETAELAYVPLVELAAAAVAAAAGDLAAAERLLAAATASATEQGSMGIVDRIRREGELLLRGDDAGRLQPS